jgi:hypothetical protein
MNSNLLIIVTASQLSEFHIERLEISHLKKYIDVKVIDLSQLIHPSLFKENKNVSSEYEEITVIKSLKNLYSYLRALKKNFPNAVFMNLVQLTNLNSLIFNSQLKFLNFSYISFLNSGAPENSFNRKYSIFFKIYLRIRDKGFYSFVTLIYFFLIKSLHSFFQNDPDYLLVAGEKNAQCIKNLHNKKTKILKGSSWDCSQYYRFRESNEKVEVENKAEFIVLLEGITPLTKGDALVENYKQSFTPEKWFPSICKFLDKLEEILKCDTRVAAHPKSHHKDRPNYLGFRKVFFNNTFELISRSNLVIGRNSAALSMAVLMNKPIITIYNNELRKNEIDIQSITAFANEMGVNSLNIDQNYSDLEISNLIKFNKSKYEEFTRNFLTSRYDEMPNYKVILDEVFDIKLN